MKRKIILMLSSLSLAFGAWAYSTETVGGVQWKYTTAYSSSESRYVATVGAADGGTTPAVPTTVTSLTVPETLGGYPVRKIGAHAFNGCSALQSLAVPACVTGIDLSAFQGCVSVTDFSMGSGTVLGGGYSVSGDWIANATTVDGIPAYKTKSFSSSSAGTSTMILSAPKYAGTLTFQHYGRRYASASSFTVTVGEDAYAIDLYNSWQRRSLDVPAGATVTFTYNKNDTYSDGSYNYAYVAIESWPESSLFDFFPGLKRVILKDAASGDAELRFSDAKHVTVSNGVTSLPNHAFRYFRELVSVILPDSVASIGDAAFSGCAAIADVRFPAGWVFRSADLARMGVPDSFVERFKTTDGNWIVMGTTLVAYVGNENVTALTIPDGVDIIDDEALAELYKLQTVTFAGTERIIGKRAFYECTDLEYVDLPETVESIEESAFENCTWIDDVYFPTELKTVGDKAFKGCGQLLECAFYEGLESIGASAFENCWRMLSVNLTHSLTNVGGAAFAGCDAIVGVVTPSNVKTMQNLFPAAYSRIEHVIIPAGETDIMNSMFGWCSRLKTLEIPNTVTNIGTSAFRYCDDLVSLALPDSVVRLGASAFDDCSSLELVALSKNLKVLEDSTFRECDKLTSLVVPASVTNLASSLFACTHSTIPETAMRDVYFLGDAPAVRSDTYSGTSWTLMTHVVKGSRGWDGVATSKSLPKSWLGRAITYWTPNVFEVTFDPNGGSPVPYAANQITDTTYALPDVAPTRPGYTFAGWWTQPEGGGEVISTTVVHATRAHTLYAHWEAAYTVEILFNPNGGTVSPDSGRYVAGATHVQFPVPTRRGYAFDGWWTGADGGENISESDRVPFVPATLYAHWSPIAYTVEFHSNNGQGLVETQEFFFDRVGELRDNPFTYEGRNFIGWARSAGGSVVHTDGDTVLNWCETQGAKIVLYAKWDGARYAVRFDENGGSGFMPNQTVLVNATRPLDANAFTRTGYTFQGWALTATGAVVYKDKGSVNNLADDDGNITLYAKWQANSYTVRFHYNYGTSTVTADQSFTWDAAKSLSYVNSGLGWTNPTGCALLGWGTSATSDFAKYANGEQVLNLTSAPGGIVHLYAIWKGASQYAVRFHKNDRGADTTVQQLFSVDQRKHLVWKDSQIGWTRVGYTFLGWAKSASATSANYLNGETVENIAAKGQTLDLYAVWKPGQVPYKVRFHRNYGDNATHDEAFVFGKQQALLWMDSQLKWTRSGYVFVGWGTSAGTSVGLYANGEKVLDLATAKDGVVHLYAVWALAKDHYVLKLYRQQAVGDTVTASVRMPKAAATSIPWKDSQLGWTLQDCSFLGWDTAANTHVAKYANGEKVTALAAAGKTVSLYAVWRPKNTYVVRFHRATSSSDTTVASQWHYCGKASGLAWQSSGLGWTPADLTFCGWSKRPSSAAVSYANGQSVTDIAKAGATLDLYAVWSYKTVFDRNAGGTWTEMRTYYIGQTAQLPWIDSELKFTRPGYTFMGWSTTRGGAVKYANGAKALNIIYTAPTLYACWRANAANVSAPATKAAAAESAAFAPGYYRGTFADGSGTFDLLLDDFDENGVAEVYFATQTDVGLRAAEGTASCAGKALFVETEHCTHVIENAGNAWIISEISR